MKYFKLKKKKVENIRYNKKTWSDQDPNIKDYIIELFHFK